MAGSHGLRKVHDASLPVETGNGQQQSKGHEAVRSLPPSAAALTARDGRRELGSVTDLNVVFLALGSVLRRS